MGRSGLPVSAIGLGCNNFGMLLDEPDSAAVVQAALDVGITLFDTADSYGNSHSEEYLGAALAGHRDDVVIATKFSTRLRPGPYGGGRHGSTSSRRARPASGGSVRTTSIFTTSTTWTRRRRSKRRSTRWTTSFGRARSVTPDARTSKGGRWPRPQHVATQRG